MYISDQLLRACFEVARRLGALSGGAIDGSFVVETVEITPSVFEFFDPFLRLQA